jgi:hypothetical protein
MSVMWVCADKAVQSAPKKEAALQKVPLYQCYAPNPAIPWSPSESVAPELGDRVLSLRSDEGVPFALTGTIVAVHGSVAEVVFDAEFMSGNSLNKRYASKEAMMGGCDAGAALSECDLRDLT